MKERFQRTFRDGVDIIDALVSKNNEGVIVYVESPEYFQRASKPKTGGV